MLEVIRKRDYNKIKKILKDNIPYSIYKEFFDTYEKDNEEILANSFFTYLCYLSEEEFYNTKNEIEIELKKKFDFIYRKIPLFNNNQNKENNENKATTVLKPKIEYEHLDKNSILDLINKQNKKEINEKEVD